MTWGQLRLLLQLAGPDLGLDVIDAAINTRYEQVLEAANWTGIQGHATIETTAAFRSASDSTTLTVGSPNVVGLGTNWDATLEGRRFYRPGDSVFYTVQGVTGVTTLILDRPYEGTGSDAPGTAKPGSAYVFMQHIYALPADCGSVVSILNPLTNRPMARLSEYALDRAVGPRTTVADPVAWDLYDDSDDSSPLHQVEFYPPPLYARGMLVEYTRAAIGFDGENTAGGPLPWVSSSVLLYGCRADIAMHLKEFNQAKAYELKFQEELARLLRVEFLQRRPITAFGTASRFTRHRLARATRGRLGAWRGGTQGGPD